MFVVPTFQKNSSKYIIETVLNNEVFRLRFFWNTREEFWYMDIMDQNDVNILTNVKLVINYSLLQQYEAIETLPKGDFILWDVEQNPIIGGVTVDNYGVRYNLLFFTNEELASGI